MIKRRLEEKIREALQQNPAVALLGPRQVGKTTLALRMMPGDKAVYIDLENDLDRQKVDDFHSFYAQNSGKLLILDEIQQLPDIFQSIRVSVYHIPHRNYFLLDYSFLYKIV